MGEVTQTSMSSDDYQDAIDLTHKQELAFNALIRAIKRCRETNIYFYGVLESLGALNGNNVKTVSDGCLSTDVHCLQNMLYPEVVTTDHWADDNHYVVLRHDYTPPEESK